MEIKKWEFVLSENSIYICNHQNKFIKVAIVVYKPPYSSACPIKDEVLFKCPFLKQIKSTNGIWIYHYTTLTFIHSFEIRDILVNPDPINSNEIYHLYVHMTRFMNRMVSTFALLRGPSPQKWKMESVYSNVEAMLFLLSAMKQNIGLSLCQKS